MYLVFTTNWGHKNTNYLKIRNNNNNVNTIKICSMYKLYNKTIGILGVPSGKCQRGEFVYHLWNVPIQIFAIFFFS